MVAVLVAAHSPPARPNRVLAPGAPAQNINSRKNEVKLHAATRRPQEEGPAQAAHAAEADEEVVAPNEFMFARHASEAAGRRPVVPRAQRAAEKSL